MTDSFEHPDLKPLTEPPLSIEYILGESNVSYEEFDGYEFDENAVPSFDSEAEEIVLSWTAELTAQEERLVYIKSQLVKAAENLTDINENESSTLSSPKSTKQQLF